MALKGGKGPRGGREIITRTPVVHITSQQALLSIQPFVFSIIIIIKTWTASVV
jgi:hypothetical protein